MADDDLTPRRSKFLEGSMNSRTSIHPPPSTFWKDSKLVEKNNRSTTITEFALYGDGTSESVPATEGIFGRFSRVATSFFRRKKAPEPVRDTRKEEYERAYHEAKRMGMLPQAQVFVRPAMRGQHASGVPSPRTPQTQTPRRYATVSKKDLQRQARLEKKVNDLEQKLAKTQEKLNEALAPPTPNSIAQDRLSPYAYASDSRKITKRRRTSGLGSDNESSYRPSATDDSDDDDDLREFGMKHKSPGGSILNKRTSKSMGPKENDTEGKSNGTLKRMSSGLQFGSKRVRTVASAASLSRITRKNSTVMREETGASQANRQPNRLTRRHSTISNTKEKTFTIVPDGDSVPPIPQIPNGMEGKRAHVGVDDDGFGGFGDEIF